MPEPTAADLDRLIGELRSVIHFGYVLQIGMCAVAIFNVLVAYFMMSEGSFAFAGINVACAVINAANFIGVCDRERVARSHLAKLRSIRGALYG